MGLGAVTCEPPTPAKYIHDMEYKQMGSNGHWQTRSGWGGQYGTLLGGKHQSRMPQRSKHQSATSQRSKHEEQ
jgi:hypothetical protein